MSEIFDSCQNLPTGKFEKLKILKNNFGEFCYDLAERDEEFIGLDKDYQNMDFCKMLTGKNDYLSNFTAEEISEKNFINSAVQQNTDQYSFNLGYNNFFISVTEEQYLDTWIETTIDVLGMSGFWLGFSFITVLEFLLLLIYE